MELNQEQLNQLHAKIDNLGEKINTLHLDVERIKVFEPKETYNRIMKIIWVFGGIVACLTFFGISNVEKLTKVEETKEEIAKLKELISSENTKLREHIIELQLRLNKYEHAK